MIWTIYIVVTFLAACVLSYISYDKDLSWQKTLKNIFISAIISLAWPLAIVSIAVIYSSFFIVGLCNFIEYQIFKSKARDLFKDIEKDCKK